MATTWDDLIAQEKNMYQTTADTLKKNYDLNVKNTNKQYDVSDRRINQDADSALRDHYLGYMDDQRNIGQKLAAAGLSGGASETSQLSMLNQYRGNRAVTERERSRGLEDSMLARNAALNGLLTGYNTDKLNAENAMNAALRQIAAQKMAAEAAERAAALKAAASKSKSSYEPDPYSAPSSTPNGGVESKQEEDHDFSPYNYDQTLNMVRDYINQGMNPDQIRAKLGSLGLSDQVINKAIAYYYSE